MIRPQNLQIHRYFVVMCFFILSSTPLYSQCNIINTVAGNGTEGYSGDGGAADTAEFWFPVGVAADASGNFYVADYFNNRIRKVNSAGVISTVAGNGTVGYAGDGGLATSAELYAPYGVAVDATGNIYIADQSNDRIRKVTAATGIITTVSGNGYPGYGGDGGAATSAALFNPARVALDAAGNIYIADEANEVIRKVTIATGIITTVAGNGTGGYSGDGGLATSAELNLPSDVGIDASGNIYIADGDNNCIRKVTVATGIITTIAGNGTLGYSGDGGNATSAELNSPYGIALDASGNIYIADQGNNCIRKVNASTGIINTIAGNGTASFAGDGGIATSAELSAFGVAVDRAGNIYIADEGNNRIREVGGCPSSVNDLNLNNSIKLYPNPNNGSFILEFTDDLARDVEITDAVGRVVVVSSKVSKQQSFNLEELTGGVYIVRISLQGEVQSMKFSLVR